MKYLTILLFTINLFSYDLVDIDFHINMVDSQDVKKVYIIDCGAKDQFIDTGVQFSVYREFDQGINNLIGRIEVYNYGYEYSKCKTVEISETLRERNISLQTLSIGDYCFPSVKLFDNQIFKDNRSTTVTKNGEREINNLLLPMILTEMFYNMKISVYLDGKGVEGREVEYSLQKGEAVKKFLKDKYNIPLTYMEVEAYGNLQTMSKDDPKKNSFIDFVFFPPEVTYVDSVYEEVIVEPLEEPGEISEPKEVEGE